MGITMKADPKGVEILLYGLLGEMFDGIRAAEVASMLKAAGKRPVLLRINSPGGDAADGVAIYNLLRSHRAGVTVQVDAEASSSASIAAMAGDTIRMASGSWMMIHEPWGGGFGTSADLRKRADQLDLITDQTVGIYDRRVDDEPKVRGWMAAETWFSAQDAVEAGLADEVGEPLAIAACREGRQRLHYRHEPPRLLDGEQMHHQALRERLARQTAALAKRG